MGGGKSQTSTQQVSIPPEVMARYNAVNARAEQVASKPFQKYGTEASDFVAQLTPEQRAGIAQTGQYAQAAQPYFQSATGQLQAAQQQGQAGLAQAQPFMQAGYQQGQQLGQEAYGGYQNLTGAFMPSYGQAQSTLAGGLGAGQQFLGGAAQYATAGAQPINAQQFSQQGIQQYMSPFMSNVVGQTMAAQAQQNAQQRQALTGEAIRAGAFGGDRAGIAQANLAYQQNLANQQTIANLLQGGYGQALGAFQQQQGVNLAAEQANRAAMQQTGQAMAGLGQQAFGMGATAAQQQAGLGQTLAGLYGQQAAGLAGLGQQQFGQGMTAGQQQAQLAQMGYGMGAGTAQALAGLGQGAQAAGLQGAQAMLGAGQIAQQTEQAGKQALYNQFLQEQGYPFQVAQFLANIAMGTGALSGSTTTTTQPAPFFSDRKLKENIRKIGETESGLPIYKFRYKGEDKDQTHIGYMADEVEKKHPDAVGEYGGAKYVDYNKVNARESMGGAVKDGGLGRSEYNPGGLVGESDLSGLLSANRKALGLPETGIHGQSPYELPRGGKSHVPTTGVYIPKLVTAGAAPRAQQPALGQGMDAYKTVRGLASDISDMKEGLTKGYNYLKDKVGSGSEAGAPPSADPEKISSIDDVYRASGGMVARHNYAGGGMPYGSEGDNPYDADEQNRVQQSAPKDVLGDVVEAGKQQIHSLPKPGEPPKPPSSGLGDAAKAVGMGANLAKGAGKLLGEGGPLAGLLGEAGTAAGAAGAGAEAAGLGAAAAGAAEGAGLLGSIGAGAAAAGEGIMAALPFLAFLSDERTKENKRVVGELYNGEKVIAYNHPGQPTQIGLGAQHVEKRDPYSVWEDDHGLKYVDYDRATRYSGGLVARHGYATDGAVEDPNSIEAISNYLIGKESAGDARARAATSSAAGLGQFTDATARTVLQRNPEIVAQLKEQGVAYDPNKRGFTADLPESVQRQMINAHVRQQQEVLRQQGYEPTRENVRMNWFLGEAGGPAFLNAMREDPNGPATAYADPAAIKANQNIFFKKDGTPRSVSEMYTVLNQGGGGVGGGRQVASTQSGAPSGMAEKAQGLGDFLTSSKFLVPLGTGLLTMASSPSRYFGAAALQGLGAGLASMQKPEMAEAQIEEKKQAAQLLQMQKFAEQGRISGSAFLVDREGRLYGVRVYRGNDIDTVSPEEYYRALREGRPYKLAPMGGAEAGAAGAQAAPAQAGPSVPGAGATTGPQIGDRGAPQGEVPVYRGLDSDMQRFLNDRVREVQVASPARLAADPTNIPFTQQDAAARTAQAGTLGRNTYVNAISSLDLSNRGKFAEQVKTPLLQWVRDTARGFGVPDSVLSQVVSFDQLAQPEILTKIRTQAAFDRDNAAKQRSFDSFMAQLQGLPGQGNSPEAASALVAEMLLTPQRDIDLNNFYNLARDYAVKKGGIPADQAQYIGRGLEQKFMERQQEKYAAEKKALMDMMFTPIKVPDANGQVKQMNVLQYMTQTGGNVPPKVRAQIEGMFGQDITRVFGGR